jgi:hypothetical protein
VRVLVPGLRAIHPSKYTFRSQRAKLESRVRSAFVAPELYETGVVRAHVFPLRPESRKVWNALLAVSFPVPLAETKGEDATRAFGAVLARGSKIVHRFDRAITLRPEGPEVTSDPRITFLEPVALEPGDYELRVVMSDPHSESPHATRLEVEVPPIPKGKLFLTGPILGRAAGVNVVVTGGGQVSDDKVGGTHSFEPLLVQQLDGPVDLVALTEACAIGKPGRGGGPTASVSRALRREDGTLIGDLPVQGIEPEGEELVRCEHLVDHLPGSALQDGRYVFEAVMQGPEEERDDEKAVRFSIGEVGVAEEK